MMVLKGHCAADSGEQKKLAKSVAAVPRYLARGYSNFCGRKEVTKNVMGQQTPLLLRHLIYDQFLLATL